MIGIEEAASVCGAKWLVRPRENTIICGGAFDTRKITSENVFFAWKGENADGHDHIDKLEGSDIKLLVVEKKLKSFPPNIAVMMVPSSIKALHAISSKIHSKFHGKTIAITGSTGKTTNKHHLARALSIKFNLHFSVGSFNNHIGCPITVLGLNKEHEILILEMGANALHEIEMLTSLFLPDISIILNIGHAHVGKFGSLDNTYKAKTEIVHNIKRNSIVIIPQDDSKLFEMVFEKIRYKSARIVKIPEYPITKMELGDKSIFRIKINHEEYDILSGLLGKGVEFTFNLILSVVRLLGMDSKSFIPSLSKLREVPGRLTPLRGKKATLIIDDTYNANPESIAYLMNVLSEKAFEKKILVLGELGELEDHYKKYAGILSRSLFDNKIQIFYKGKIIGEICNELVNMVNNSFTAFETADELTSNLNPLLGGNTVLAFKGSRLAGMEKFMKLFLENDADATN